LSGSSNFRKVHSSDQKVKVLFAISD